MDERLLDVESTLVRLRPLVREEVPFIFDIRHSERGSWLNSTSPDIADQYTYFDGYMSRFDSGDEIYYMVHDRRAGRDAGIVRLTRLLETEGFGWEGLVMIPESTPGCALDVAASIYSVGFDWLGRSECGPWKVLKSNTRVMRMHEMMGLARKVGEDEGNWFVSVTRADFCAGIGGLRRRGFGRIDDRK